MSSLFAKEKGRVKRSVDLSPKTDEVLDNFRILAEKDGVSLSRGAAIDAVLGAILSLSPAQAARIYTNVSKELKVAQDTLDATSRDDVLSHRRAADEVESWERVTELFDILSDDYTEPAPMRSIPMSGCHIIVPDAADWIIVNAANAADSTHATVVEIKNGSRFNAPHFVFFDCGEASTEAIDAAIIAVYPQYENVLAARVEPIRDTEGNLLNLGQLKEAPMPGYFPVHYANDPAQETPYGVVLVPEKGEHKQTTHL